MDSIAKQLARIAKTDKDRPRKKVTILGAGMAGLAAAYELKNLGHDVQVFEASDRERPAVVDPPPGRSPCVGEAAVWPPVRGRIPLCVPLPHPDRVRTRYTSLLEIR
jgi:hypothetical protein